MTMMEIIVGAIATVLALIFGAFHLGKSREKVSLLLRPRHRMQKISPPVMPPWQNGVWR